MVKKNSIRFEILFIFLLVIVIFGCVPVKDSKGKDFIRGSEGLAIDFAENYPQDSYIVSEKEPISIIVDIRNKGVFPQEDEESGKALLGAGKVYISGFDDNIIKIEKSKSLSDLSLLGASSINPEGGSDIVKFDGEIIADKIMVDKYESSILATVCYIYVTNAGPNVCIDPYPFDKKGVKVCEIGSQTLTSQGAPVAVTKIDEEASSTKIQFKIHIKNGGGGDIINIDALEKCNPSGKEILKKDDFDKIKLMSVKIGTNDITSSCGPFAGDGNAIGLYNGEGFIICSLDKDDFADVNYAYTTSLNIILGYVYRSTTSKPMKILKMTDIS